MTQFIRLIKSHFTINEQYLFNDSSAVVHNYLKHITSRQKGRNFYSKYMDNNVYEIIANRSLGTLRGFGDRALIKIQLDIEAIDDAQARIRVSTKIRPENWFFLVLFSFMFFGVASSDEPYYTSLFVLVLMPIFLLWFNFVHKMQERALVNEISRILNLRQEHLQSLA